MVGERHLGAGVFQAQQLVAVAGARPNAEPVHAGKGDVSPASGTPPQRLDDDLDILLSCCSPLLTVAVNVTV
jgi:hypothetical protein